MFLLCEPRLPPPIFHKKTAASGEVAVFSVCVFRPLPSSVLAMAIGALGSVEQCTEQSKYRSSDDDADNT